MLFFTNREKVDMQSSKELQIKMVQNLIEGMDRHFPTRFVT